MGRPRKVIEGIDEPIEEIVPEPPVEIKPSIKIESDGKVSVMKNGVTRRIYPGQLESWRVEGWK